MKISPLMSGVIFGTVGLLLGRNFSASFSSRSETTKSTSSAQKDGEINPSNTSQATATTSGDRNRQKAEESSCKLENFSRKEILSAVRPSEIQLWRKTWMDHSEEQVKRSPVLWHNGSNEQANSQFDAASAANLLGNYEGTLEYDLSSERKRLKYNLHLAFNSFEPNQRKNSLKMNSKEFGTFSGEFGIDWLGSDSSSKSLNVVWYNFNGNAEADCGYFGMQLPYDFQKGRTESLDLSCLDETFAWHPMGKVTLTRK